MVLVSLSSTWTHLVSHGFTWIHVVHLDSLGSAWSHLDHLISVNLIRLHSSQYLLTKNILTVYRPTKRNSNSLDHKGKKTNNNSILRVSGPRTNWLEMAPNGAGSWFSPLIQTLPTFLATRILILRIWIFCFYWIPDFWIYRFLDSQIQGCHLVIFVRGGSIIERQPS